MGAPDVDIVTYCKMIVQWMHFYIQIEDKIEPEIRKLSEDMKAFLCEIFQVFHMNNRVQWVNAISSLISLYIDLCNDFSHWLISCPAIAMHQSLVRLSLQWRHNEQDGVSNPKRLVYSGSDQIKHQSSASLAYVRGIHRWPVNSQHKGPVTRKMFPIDDVIMWTMQFAFTTIWKLALLWKLRHIWLNAWICMFIETFTKIKACVLRHVYLCHIITAGVKFWKQSLMQFVMWHKITVLQIVMVIWIDGQYDTVSLGNCVYMMVFFGLVTKPHAWDVCDVSEEYVVLHNAADQ